MFGKPEWFREAKSCCGLLPICWQGGLYCLIWLGVLALPTLVFLMPLQRAPEALLWLVFAGFLMMLDSRAIIRAQRRQTAGDVFVIDDATDATHLETRQYEMHLRDDA